MKKFYNTDREMGGSVLLDGNGKIASDIAEKVEPLSK